MSTSIKDNKIRVLVLGAPTVGKTSLIEYFTRENFVEEATETGVNSQNVEVSFIVELEEGRDFDERRFAIESAHAYILMYALDDPKSFGVISILKDEIIKIKGPGMPMTIVGNKIDRFRKNGISLQTSCAVRNYNGIPHICTSVTEDLYVRQVYRELFQHETLQKLRDVVHKINSSTLFSNFRKMLLQAESLEKTVASVFPELSPRKQCE